MSTENEAGSSAPAAESASAHEGAAPDGAPAAPTPPASAPAAPPAPAGPPAAAPADQVPAPAAAPVAEEARTEVLPPQAPPPVGPPSPYGPPPSALGEAAPAPVPAAVPPTPVPPAPAAAPTPAPAPAGYPAAPPAAAPLPPQAAPSYDAPAPAYDATTTAYDTPAPAPAYDAPAASTAAFAAEQPPQGQPGPGGPQKPVSDPFAVPSTPSYASPNPQPGSGGSGAPGGPGWGTPMPAGAPSGDGRKRRGLGGMLAAVLVAALVAGGIGGGIGYYAAKHNDDNGSTTVSAPVGSKALNRAPTSVAGIANRVLPSVVTIKAQNSQESDTGTGFVFDTQGHILTNNHVVAPGAASGGKLTVTFSNGNTYNASVVGRAQGYDVAVIKLQDPGNVKLTPLPLGNSDEALVGDATIAIGAPYGLSGTVTTGIVSAVHRPVASSDGQGSTASYMSAIQTDASINPGNSGGPLLNANGAVIGINSAIQPSGDAQPGQQGGSVGLGFAIPINQAKRVAEQLIKTGQPVYPVIGVSLDTQYDGDGAKISTDSSSAITPGGPGAKAGLKPGDVITRFDGTLVDSGETLIGEIWQHQPGDKVTITYTRDGSTHTATVTLGSRIGDTNN